VSFVKENAHRLYQTAARVKGPAASEISLVVRGDGSLYVVMGNGWTPEALAAHHGAQAVYRVQRFPDHVRVEAQAAGERVLLANESPALTARRLLNGTPRPWLPETSPAAG
jgi:hypothetical protein